MHDRRIDSTSRLASRGRKVAVASVLLLVGVASSVRADPLPDDGATRPVKAAAAPSEVGPASGGAPTSAGATPPDAPPRGASVASSRPAVSTDNSAYTSGASGPVTQSGSDPVVAQAFVSGGYRSIHFEQKVDAGLGFAFHVTAKGTQFTVSDVGVNNNVKLYDLSTGIATFVRTFGSAGSGNGQFSGPEQTAIIGNDLFVADFNNNRVQRFNLSSGAFQSTFGSTGSGAGQFSLPSGLVYNPVNGFLYVSDIGNDRVQYFTTAGVYQGSFASLGSGNGQVNNPFGLGVDSFGNIYVADSGNNRVAKFSSTGTWIRNLAIGATSPLAVTVDGADKVWVTTSNDVYAYDSAGNYKAYYYGTGTGVAAGTEGYFSTLRGVAVMAPISAPPYNGAPVVILSDTSGVQLFTETRQTTSHTTITDLPARAGAPFGIAFDSAENVYVTSFGENKVYKYSKFGALITSWGSAGTGNGQFNGPDGITIDDSDNVYVTDYGNSRVQKFSFSGAYLSQFGTAGTGNGQFNNPAGITTDGLWLYVADPGNTRVQKFSLAGGYVRQWGTSGSGNGQFLFPTGIAVDRSRNQVYVSEFGGNRVQQFSVFGDFLTVFPAPSTALSGSVSVSTDQRGNLYVADRGNNRVVQYSDNGTFLTSFAFTGANAVGVNPKNGQLWVGAIGSPYTVTRFSAAAGKSDTIGLWRASDTTFYLRKSNTTGAPEITSPIQFALPSDQGIVGDWNGDGIDTPGVYRSSSGFFYLWDRTNNLSMSSPDYLVLLGNPGDQPYAGDWDGDGRDSVGVYRPSNGILYLRNEKTTGFSQYNMVLGNPSDTGLAGDWNGDGADSTGIFRPSQAQFYFTNRNTQGITFSDINFVFGSSTDIPFIGDWDNDAVHSTGLFRNGTIYLRNSNTAGAPDTTFSFGTTGDQPLAGLWGPAAP